MKRVYGEFRRTHPMIPWTEATDDNFLINNTYENYLKVSDIKSLTKEDIEKLIKFYLLVQILKTTRKKTKFFSQHDMNIYDIDGKPEFVQEYMKFKIPPKGENIVYFDKCISCHGRLFFPIIGVAGFSDKLKRVLSKLTKKRKYAKNTFDYITEKHKDFFRKAFRYR